MLDSSIECPNCHSPNAHGSNYCSSCGHHLGAGQTVSDKKDQLLIISLFILIGATFFWLALDLLAKVAGYEIYDQVYFLNKLVNLSTIAAVFMLAFAVRSRSMRPIMLVFAIVYALIRLYWFVTQIIADYTYEPEFFQF